MGRGQTETQKSLRVGVNITPQIFMHIFSLAGVSKIVTTRATQINMWAHVLFMVFMFDCRYFLYDSFAGSPGVSPSHFSVAPWVCFLSSSSRANVSPCGRCVHTCAHLIQPF